MKLNETKIDNKWKDRLLWQLSARIEIFYHNYVNSNNTVTLTLYAAELNLLFSLNIFYFISYQLPVYVITESKFSNQMITHLIPTSDNTMSSLETETNSIPSRRHVLFSNWSSGWACKKHRPAVHVFAAA